MNDNIDFTWNIRSALKAGYSYEKVRDVVAKKFKLSYPFVTAFIRILERQKELIQFYKSVKLIF